MTMVPVPVPQPIASNDHVSAKGEKASRRAPWLVTGEHDELVNTTETGQRVRQHRRVR